MAIYLEGNIAASIGFSLEARTLVSLSFARNLRLPPTNRLLLTTSLPVYGTFSTLLQVEFSADLTNDVCLGLDWSSFLRESLILSGYRPGNAFDAATFLLSGGASFSGLPPLSHGRSLNVHPDDTPGGSGTRSVPVYNDVEPHNDITRATYSSRSFTAVATPSSRSATSDCDKRRPDLSSLLLSSHSDLNVFMLPSAALKAELEKHHISGANDLSDDQARYAILSHLLCGACIGTCDNANASLHACSSHIGLISSSMGLPRAVVDQHSAANPALAVLDNVDKLPKGSLISLAQSHGLSVHKKDSFVLLNLAQLRRVVWEHLGAGECTRKESYASYLGCSSVASQLCDPSESLEGQDDPSVRMQVAILKNLVPILKIGPLRRLLDLHDRPSAVARSLPPSITDIITPVCVIFVGSKPPTEEWLKKKATPLIVRKERVMNALAWLKVHNHLYRDVLIDHTVLASQPDETIPAFHIQHNCSKRRDRFYHFELCSWIVAARATVDSTAPRFTRTSSSPPPSPIQFQSVVVADVDGNAPSNELRSAALKHMRKPGNNYIEIPHDDKPVNEFDNPHLFPMIYPMLFPYGLGGLEDDARFQEHYSFLFTSFNMIQRRALLLHTKLKADRASFDYVAARFGTVSPLAVHKVAERVAAGDRITADTPEERRVLRMMKEANLITSHVPGSAQSRLVMRNEIRALMIEKGMPSFYITINPADVYNPLVKFLAGSEINLDALTPKDIPIILIKL
ncbi:hypothetical protein B0H13DRAFT_2331271 [Mycena leptocephala]|nr:hypothetical protein B0H13DRAFT_2331271 [Mycena leptocephala]